MFVATPAFAETDTIVEIKTEAETAPENAVLAIKGEPQTKVFRVENGERIPLGEIDETGMSLIDPGVAEGTYDFVFTNANADGECILSGVKLSPGKVVRLLPTFRMKVGELAVACIPTDVEVFIDGEHQGRGVVVLGNMPVGKEVTVEARSATLGTQSQTVKIPANSTARVTFDMRKNKPAPPDGRIRLPEVQLALASQPGATISIDGEPATLKDGGFTGLTLGMHVVEISLPLGEKQVSVWKGAFPARSAIMPASAKAAQAVEIPEVEFVATSTEELPVATTEPVDSLRKIPAAGTRIRAVVDFVLDATRLKFSVVDPDVALPGNGLCKIFFAGSDLPVPAETSSTTPDGAIATFLVPESLEGVTESEPFEIEFIDSAVATQQP